MPSKKSSPPEADRRIRTTTIRTKAAGPRQVPLLFPEPVGLMAGVDEAGRGPLAGPVVAAAVILDDKKRILGLADSKVLTPLQRDKLYDKIREKALCCSVGMASVEEIHDLNIFHATMLAIEDAMVRFARLRGKRALWIPGTDHAARTARPPGCEAARTQGRGDRARGSHLRVS